MKKLFGKRGIALLTTLALVVSMVAMLGGLTASAEYSPKRTMSITAGGTQIEGKILMYQTAEILGANKDIVIKGYYKVDGYVAKNDTDHNVQIAPGATGAASVKADCDWTPFEATWNTGETGVYHVLKFGFWYAQGTMSLADIVIEDTEGNVLYDFATDKDLPAGDIAGGEQYGFWYFGYYGDKSEFSGKIDAAVETGYQPKRALSMAVSNNDVNAKIVFTGSGDKVGAGKTVTVKGYYKLENFAIVEGSSGESVSIASDLVKLTADTDGWVYFEKEGYVTGNDNWLGFSFWYSTGTLSLADIVFEENGKVIYAMESDEDLPEGTHNSMTVGMWYMHAYNNSTNATITIDPVVVPEDPCANGHKYVGGVCENCGAEKEYPVIEGDTTYQPKRVMSVQTWGGANGAAGTAIEGKLMFTKAGTYFPDHNIVVVKGYYKIENYKEAVNGSGKCVQIGAGNRANGEETQSPAGNTNGWVEFSVSYRPKDYGEPDWNQALKFGFWYTHGKLSLADITVESTTGEVLYDMAYDEELIAGTYAGPALQEGGDDVRQMGLWWIGTYGYDDWADVEIVIDEALEKPVTPPAQTGDVNMIVVVALGAMAAMTLAVVTLNKKKFSV